MASRLDHLGNAATVYDQVVVARVRDGPVDPKNDETATARTTNLSLR